jgi:hypothetical protein
MIKQYFLIAFLFFAVIFHADAQTVAIPDSAAVFFLRQNEKVKILNAEINNLQKQIINLKLQIGEKTAVSQTQVVDSVSYNNIIKELNTQLSLKQDQVKLTKKEIKKYKLHEWVAYGVAAAAIVIGLLIAK